MAVFNNAGPLPYWIKLGVLLTVAPKFVLKLILLKLRPQEIKPRKLEYPLIFIGIDN
jgi:hypothetical protein